jgi:hypothetical protein
MQKEMGATEEGPMVEATKEFVEESREERKLS